MARSASDATRFTATGPYAAAKSSVTSTSIPLGRGAPANETAQQKIARLRAAAAQARSGKETQFDRVVRVGRVWADRAHRATTLSLIGLTLVSGVIATFAIGDMLIHNRRKRNEWLEEQQANTARQLIEARRAETAGIATEDQMLLINRERAAMEAEEARKNRKGLFTKAKESVFGGLSEEEQQGGKIGAAARAALDKVEEKIPEHKPDLGIVKAVEDKLDHLKKGEVVEQVLHPAWGPLDRQAAASVQAIEQKSKSWTAWLTGR